MCRPKGWISCLLPVRPGCTRLWHGDKPTQQCLCLYLDPCGLIPLKVTLFFYTENQADFTLSSFIDRSDWALVANIRLIIRPVFSFRSVPAVKVAKA